MDDYQAFHLENRIIGTRIQLLRNKSKEPKLLRSQ